MALAIDSSTPARFSGSTDVTGHFTTGTFNTPANCLIVVTVEASATSGTSETYSLTNNGAAVTWSTIGQSNRALTGNDDFAGAYCVYLSAARTGMTITATNSTTASSIYTTVKVYNVTGANSSTPIGGVKVSSASGSPVTTSGFTVTSAGSFGFLACVDPTNAGTVSSTDTTFDSFQDPLDCAGGSGYKSLGSAGSSATFNITGGSSAVWNYVTFEVIAATSGGGGGAPTPAIPVFTNGTVYHASDLNALGSNLTNLYNYTLSGFRTYKPLTVVRILGTGWSTSSGSPALMQFDTVDIDTNGGFDSFLANSGIYSLAVRTSGIYRLYLQFTIVPPTIDTGQIEAHLCVNGTSISTNAVSASWFIGRAINTHATVGLTVGNSLYGVVTQSTGAGQSSSLTYGGSYLVMEWISP